MAEIIKAHQIRAANKTPGISPDEPLRAMDEFFAEIDNDPASGAEALTDEALRRRNLYDDYRNRY